MYMYLFQKALVQKVLCYLLFKDVDVVLQGDRIRDSVLLRDLLGQHKHLSSIPDARPLTISTFSLSRKKCHSILVQYVLYLVKTLLSKRKQILCQLHAVPGFVVDRNHLHINNPN